MEDDEEEEFSEYEDHMSVNSESDSEFEEEDEIDHQPAPKRARQQPATGPAPEFTYDYLLI